MTVIVNVLSSQIGGNSKLFNLADTKMPIFGAKNLADTKTRILEIVM